MTPKAEALLDAVTCVTKPCDHHLVSEPLRLLVAYIEELERKAQAYDADYNPPRLGDQTYGK